jgi:hypothetical protein
MKKCGVRHIDECCTLPSYSTNVMVVRTSAVDTTLAVDCKPFSVTSSFRQLDCALQSKFLGAVEASGLFMSSKGGSA